MNPALTSYVLVDVDNQPVPLPYHTTYHQGEAVTITSFSFPSRSGLSGYIYTNERNRHFPSVCDLKIITENEFMATQAGRPSFHLIDPATGAEVPLPHYLPNDQTVTRIDGESLVCETTRSITWLDPSVYGLAIIADCDLQVPA